MGARFKENEFKKIKNFLISKGYSVHYKFSLFLISKNLSIDGKKYSVRLIFESLPWKNNFLSIDYNFLRIANSLGGYTISSLYSLKEELKREISDEKKVSDFIKETAAVIYSDLKDTALFLKKEKITDKIIFFNTASFEGNPFGIYLLKEAGIPYSEHINFVLENFYYPKGEFLYDVLSDYIESYRNGELYNSVFEEIKEEYVKGFLYLIKKISELNEDVEIRKFMYGLNRKFTDFFLSSDVKTPPDLEKFKRFYFFGALYQSGVLMNEIEKIRNDIQTAISAAALAKNDPASETGFSPLKGISKNRILKLKKSLEFASDCFYMFEKEDLKKIIQTGILCFKYLEHDPSRKKEKTEIETAVLKAVKNNPLFLLEFLKKEEVPSMFKKSLEKNREEALKNISGVFKKTIDLKFLKKAVAYFGNSESKNVFRTLSEFDMYAELKKLNYAKEFAKKLREKSVIKEKKDKNVGD